MDRAVSSGFVRPDFSVPIDLEAQKRLIQPGATVKGMQLQALVDECKKRGVAIGTRKYTSFREYPGEELLDLLVATAQGVWPNVSTREGLRRVGRLAYPTLYHSLIGRVVFGALARDIHRIWGVVSKGYALSGSTGSATLVEVRDNDAIVRLEGIYSFVDSWHVGIFEGAVELYDAEPEVLVKKTSPTSADFLVRWRETALRPSRPPAR